MKKILLAICLTVIFTGLIDKKVSAVSAYPYPVEITQADGTTIMVQLKGDEKVKWGETLDGYTILINNQGIYEYAIATSKGDLTLSGVTVNNINVRTPEELALLKTTSKALFYSKDQVSTMKSIWKIKDEQLQKGIPTSGNVKIVCILAAYQDVAFTKTRTDFINLFNQVGYSAGTAAGSVKDFYDESSYGQLNLTVDVAGPYTANNNMSYYGANDASGYDLRPRELVTEMCQQANADVNFADYDNDNDGTLDGVHVIFAGNGEEAGASSNAIWSHKWAISTISLDGTSINVYSCSPERRGATATTITGIGVVCHEIGHVFGAPDYYDTDYTGTGGSFSGTGYWDMMAAGSWNDNGDEPAQHNAFTKVYVYGWASATTLSTAVDVTVTNSIDNSSIYRINSTTSGEYWLMENRQNTGFDGSIPGHGLMIYHVHKDVLNVGNVINVGAPQKMYPVCASASTNPSSTPSSYGTINGAGCTFPGTSNTTSFTDVTTPNMKSWAGANTNSPITDIVENTTTKTITFKFKGGGSSDTEAPTTPGSLSYGTVTSSTVALSWNTSTDNVAVTGYDVYKNGAFVANASGTSYTVTGLNPSTSYSFYVKAKDAAGNESGASNTVNATTGIATISCSTTISSLPYTEGFESGIGAWTQSTSDDFDWANDASGTPSSNTGPSSADEGSYYMFVESSSPNYPSKVAIFNSPCFDLTSESNASFNFAYHMYGSAMGTMQLQATTNGTNWTTLWTKSGDQGNSWFNETVSLSSYYGATVQLRYVATTSTSYTSDFAIDDISVTNGVTPTGTDLTLTITFDNYPEETSWTLKTSGGSSVASGGTYASQADGSTLNIPINGLADDCYVFTILDAYGDGICCSYGSGSYTLKVTGGSTIVTGSTFTSSAVTNFCIPYSASSFAAATSSFDNVNITPAVNVYPNPASSYINVQVTNAKANGMISIYSATGALVKVVEMNESEREIDISELASGLYLITVDTKKEAITKQFIKK
ncbi:MAG: M6 family metalloprotease domain-containing protein [Bacteroidales bacterium]|nr:M6 family metalloprotease domain-containing protein [Bacteroidales bacterium]